MIIPTNLYSKKFSTFDILIVLLASVSFSALMYYAHKLQLSVEDLQNANIALSKDLDMLKQDLNQNILKQKEIRDILSEQKTDELESVTSLKEPLISQETKKLLVKGGLISVGLIGAAYVLPKTLFSNPVLWIFNKLLPTSLQKLCALYIPGFSTVVAKGSCADNGTNTTWFAQINSFEELNLQVLEKNGSDPISLAKYLEKIKAIPSPSLANNADLTTKVAEIASSGVLDTASSGLEFLQNSPLG